MAVHEVLDRRRHVPTQEEKAEAAKLFGKKPPAFDHFASGRLQVVLISADGTLRTTSDTDTQSLDDCLGLAVRRVSDIAAHERRQRWRAEERDREWAEQQRVWREKEERAKHAQRLKDDLDEKLARWRRAEELRAFLRAVDAAVPESERDKVFVAWIRWVGECARGIDPVSAGRGIALPLRPTAS